MSKEFTRAEIALLGLADTLFPAEDDEKLTKDDVIRRLCSLTSKVMRERFNYKVPADCLCNDGPADPYGFRFSDQVLKFVEDAVTRALQEQPSDVG